VLSARGLGGLSFYLDDNLSNALSSGVERRVFEAAAPWGLGAGQLFDRGEVEVAVIGAEALRHE
jgi:hypothetical protein